MTSDIQGRQKHYQWNTTITKQGFVSLWERAAMVQPPFAKSQSSHDTRYFMALHSSITRLLHHPRLNCPRPAQTELGRQCPKILTLHIQLTFSTFQNVPFNDSFSFSPQPTDTQLSEAGSLKEGMQCSSPSEHSPIVCAKNNNFASMTLQDQSPG